MAINKMSTLDFTDEPLPVVETESNQGIAFVASIILILALVFLKGKRS